jgi:PKD repeat protein
MKFKKPLLSILMCLTLVSGFLPLTPGPSAPRALAQTNTLTLSLISARSEPDAPGGPVLKGDAVTEYKYLINVDNTGDPGTGDPVLDGCSVDSPGYPDSCDWPSVREVPGAAPIFTQGDQDDFNGVLGTSIDLPDGKYLISVLADGYKMSGAHFTVPLADPGLVTVELQPHPLPSATMRIKVYEDISPINGAFDAPGEFGLPGFFAIIKDPAGDVTTDVFGNPLCTQYDAFGEPIPGTGTTDCLISDANGDIVIPNLGPNRYDVEVAPPADEGWLHTSTLEGSWSWDSWLAEGGTGLDNEFVVAGEPFPWTVFGFVRPQNTLAGGTGGVSGTIVGASVYVPQQNGLPYQGGVWGGLNGTKVTGPIEDAWVALSDLQNGDSAVYVGQANTDGSFYIPGVPDGNYLFTWWDEPLHHLLDWTQITVSNGEIYDMGAQQLTGWFTRIDGYVFNDLNKNGVKDGGEPGIANYLVGLRDRDNSEIDRMSVAVTTDSTGYYVFERAYPMGSWMVLEAYNDTYYTTGITYQVENQPTPTTVLGDGVDVGVLPILGQAGRLDWGVHKYEAGTNGGIVGSVFYEVTRNEFDSQYEAVEPWSVGIPGLTMNLYATVPCGTNTGTDCDPTGFYEIADDGSLAKGALLDTTETEVWEQPVDCTARDANGVPLPFPDVQNVLAPYTGGFRCLEGPLMGTQFQSGFASLDGNWGFTGIPAGDYLVEVVIPDDAFGRPVYQVVREETVNVFGGDQYVPAVPPPACAGAMHTVDVAGILPDGPDAYDNPSFADGGGSPFEGTQMPLCDVKLVNLGNGKSIAPTFNLFTEVPIPGKWKGYIIDDLALSFDKTSLTFGEKAGLANSPVGIYDFANRLVTTITSDYNGTYEVLLPSTHTVNCPSPSGVCASMYYMQGNDPGQPGQLNPNYNPQYRTIGATFEIWSGQMLPSDLAPTQMVIGVLNPSTTQSAPADCSLPDTAPQLFAVSQPYLYRDVAGSFTIQGQGFGPGGGSSAVTLGGTPVPIVAWSDTQIDVSVPLAFLPAGMYQLEITNADGESTINGLTFHYLGSGYNPQIYEVGPGRAYSTIQAAVDAASSFNGNRGAMVVVYPGLPAQWNPLGYYLENVIINKSIKLQGVGPGGVYADETAVLGSVIDGRGVAGDTVYADQWRAFVATLNWDGNQNIYEGAVVYYLAEDGEFEQDIRRQSVIDGFTIQGGDQQGFPGPLAFDGTLKEALAVQGGGIFANAFARYLQITNNVLQSNGGAYAGAIRLGTPHLPGALNDNQNDNVRIAHNRINSNGGTNLAGAIGIFSGSEGYEVAHNDICGNFSAEYGGGISHYGLSPNGAIHHNRVYFNRAYDEGGGIMIAGELPPNPAILSSGAGAVDVYANLIQANLGNDDGGGLRFLMAGNFTYNVYNNMIVNNISSHEGGGVSLNDAPDVRFYNNTVMKNITTATAVTSNGSPAPAGLSSSRNSATLQATLPGGSPIFSDPLLFNNIFWDNRAGTWTGGGVAGIGQPGDLTPIYNWDLGVADGTGDLSPTNSLMQVTTGTNLDGSNVVGSDPSVVTPFDVSVQVLPWRGNANFIDPLIVSLETRVDLLGDFHLAAGSPAIDMGAADKDGISAPADDFDSELRPVAVVWDMGADEFGGSTAPPNQPPTASFTFVCSGLDCTFDASTSSDPDGTIVTYAWDFGDGSPVDDTSGVMAIHTYAAPGSYDVQLTVTDDGSVPANDVIIQQVVVSDAADMHVGDLDPDVIIIRPGQNNERWDAIVRITVHDATHLLPVEGATVSVEGTRTNSNNGNVSTGSFACITAADGTCQVSWRINPFNFEDSVTFTVLDVTHASLNYVAGANHDPDGDSDGTTIVVTRP